jgi:hypothetical protein
MPFSYDQFKRNRKDWVEELENYNKIWYRFRKSRQTNWERKQNFLEMLQSQLNQTLEYDFSELTKTRCFAVKIRQILGAIPIATEDAVIRGEVLNMITTAIGRLTFDDGYGEEDKFALRWDKRAMKADKEWDENSPGNGDIEYFRREQLRLIWSCLSVILKDCYCLQCVKRRPSANASEAISKSALALMWQRWRNLFSGI